MPESLRGPDHSIGCKDCPFAKDGKAKKPVPGIGPAEPAWAVVGEGPGAQETASGLPFVGASGRLLNKSLVHVGVDRETLWVGNATLCQPFPNASETAKKEAQKCCRPRLQDELAGHLPKGKPVLALGGVAAQGFLGDDFSITQLAGSLHDVDVDGSGERPIIPTIHPAAILRGGAGAAGAHDVDLLYWNLLYDIAKIAAVAAGKQVRFSDDIEIEAEDPEKADALVRAFVRQARKERVIGIDAETEGTGGHSALEGYYARLTAIGVATPTRGISVAYKILRPGTLRLIAAILGDSTIENVLQNGIYDCPIFDRHGLPIRGKLFDTLLAHHNAFPGLSHDLQRVSTQFFAISPWKAEYREGKGELEELLRYNAKDALATVRLRAPLEMCVKKSQSEKTYEIDMEMARYAERMHVVGIPISKEVNAELTERFGKQIAESRKALEEFANADDLRDEFIDRLAAEQAKRVRKKDPLDFLARHAIRVDEAKTAWEKGKLRFKINSPDHVAAYLRAKGVPLYMKTPKGRTSTKKEILETLAHLPEIQGLLDYREASKMFSTFVKSLPFFMDGHGRIHPSWNVHRITGRWSAERPQVMNWPKGDPRKNRPNLRTQVVAPKGRIFVGADFAQLEARLHALLSGDAFLCDIFTNDKDVHVEFARVVWPEYDQQSLGDRKRLRDMVKRPEYGALYGAVVETMYKAVVRDYPEVKLADLQRMNLLMKQKLTGVERWHQELLKQVAQTQEIRSFLFGRRRCFPLGNADPPTVFNFPIQSAAADLFAVGLGRLVPKLPKSADAILQVHDSIVVECREDDAERVRDLVTECLSQEYTHNGITVKFPADAEIDRSWAEV